MPARGLSGKYQGSKWLTRERRLSIYLRDGLACCYCGASVEDGTMLTLDHLIPDSAGGSKKSENLITACRRCNSSRGARAVDVFCDAVAGYLNHGVTGSEILTHIMTTAKRPVDIKAAKALIAARGGFSKALQG